MKGKTHDLNHDLTFSAHTINCVCHSIRSMFRVLGMYNFGAIPKNEQPLIANWDFLKCKIADTYHFEKVVINDTFLEDIF